MADFHISGDVIGYEHGIPVVNDGAVKQAKGKSKRPVYRKVAIKKAKKSPDGKKKLASGISKKSKAVSKESLSAATKKPTAYQLYNLAIKVRFLPPPHRWEAVFEVLTSR
jgi:hypothetical protein